VCLFLDEAVSLSVCVPLVSLSLCVSLIMGVSQCVFVSSMCVCLGGKEMEKYKITNQMAIKLNKSI